jgi:hypothetical protein
MDGAGQQTVAAKVNTDGTTTLWYDLGSTTTGTHNVTVKAKSLWGESTASPFVFTKPASLSAPSGVDITR